MPRNPLEAPPAPTLVSWQRRLLHKLFPEFTGSGRDYAVIVFWIVILGVSLTHLFVLKAAYETPAPLLAEEGSPGDDGDGSPGTYNPRQPRNDSPLLDTVASPSPFDHDPREALFARYNDRSEAAVLLRRLLSGDYDYEDEVLTGAVPQARRSLLGVPPEHQPGEHKDDPPAAGLGARRGAVLLGRRSARAPLEGPHPAGQADGRLARGAHPDHPGEHRRLLGRGERAGVSERSRHRKAAQERWSKKLETARGTTRDSPSSRSWWPPPSGW